MMASHDHYHSLKSPFSRQKSSVNPSTPIKPPSSAKLLSPNSRSSRSITSPFSRLLPTSNSPLQPPPPPKPDLHVPRTPARKSILRTKPHGSDAQKVKHKEELHLGLGSMNPFKSSIMRSASDDRNGNQNLEVGDTVDVPGGMHGTIKFIGEVRGKKGTFAGVELAREWAARGKNDGDVDGTMYFTTSIKGAGIFLPSNKAYRRLSPSLSSAGSVPPTPTQPSAAPNHLDRNASNSHTAQSVTASATKLSQSVGPGRASSPMMKSKRPSLPRPESPQRKAQNAASTPQPRASVGKPNFSKSMIGGPRHAPSPTPNKFGGSVRGSKDIAGDPGKRTAMTPKPAIRKPTGARPTSPIRHEHFPPPPLGPETMFDEEPDPIPYNRHKQQPSVRNSQQTSRNSSEQDNQIQSLRIQLEERDRQLERYAADLDEMQNSITELQTLSPKPGSGTNRSSRSSGLEHLDAPSLRALVREKEEKVTNLIREFDSHRADFRETIDILEHTADETNRHYEERLAHLETQVREQNDREGDVQSVAEQLLTLERHVEELEEGLEDSRRGESEARAEVEHLRGEVERGKAEMRREREKAANNRAYGGDSATEARLQREVAHRDNEINGLKAIIHSLSRDPPATGPSSPRSSRRSRPEAAAETNGVSSSQLAEERRLREQMEREVKDLQNLVDQKTYREEELEHEIKRLHKHSSQLSSAPSNATAIPNNVTNSPRHIHSHSRSLSNREPLGAPTTHRDSNVDDTGSSTTHLTDSPGLWCEMCEVSGHDILHCSSMGTLPTPPQPQQQVTPLAIATNGVHRPRQHGGSNGDSLDGPAILQQRPKEKENIGPAPKVAPPKARMPNPSDNGMVAGKESGVVDASRWCALCERDGHESVDCPFDDDY